MATAKKNPNKKPGMLKQIATVAKGVMSDLKDAVPKKNKVVTDLYRAKIDRHVDGKPPKKKK